VFIRGDKKEEERRLRVKERGEMYMSFVGRKA
jgi:hypothetical protein